MRESLARIKRVRHVGDGWQHVILSTNDPALLQLQPGQTLMIRRSDALEPYLREQWIPVDVDTERSTLTIERPSSDALNPADEINILGPIGSSFVRLPSARRLLLVVMDYPPTLLRMFFTQAIQANREVTLVFCAMQQAYPLHSLPAQIEAITSDALLSWPSFKETIYWADQIFVLTAPEHIEARYPQFVDNVKDVRPALAENFLNGIFDLPLACGLGGCFACMVKNKLACIDGPAFDLAKHRF